MTMYFQLTLCVLKHSNDADFMNSLLNTFFRYEAIWTCMDIMPTIVNALDAAHHMWKLRGVQSRPLLALLMKFDKGRHLETHSRDKISSDIAAFELVSFLRWRLSNFTDLASVIGFATGCTTGRDSSRCPS